MSDPDFVEYTVGGSAASAVILNAEFYLNSMAVASPDVPAFDDVIILSDATATVTYTYNVPDGGATALMLGVGLLGLAALKRTLRGA